MIDTNMCNYVDAPHITSFVKSTIQYLCARHIVRQHGAIPLHRRAIVKVRRKRGGRAIVRVRAIGVRGKGGRRQLQLTAGLCVGGCAAGGTDEGRVSLGHKSRQTELGGKRKPDVFARLTRR